MLRDIILDVKNIEKLTKKSKKEYFNISTLLGCPLKQGQSICFGHVFENILKGVLKEKNIKVFDTKFLYLGIGIKKTKKEIDLLFKINKTLYYFEAKTNLNLDSEKCVATDKKITNITNYLKSHIDDFKCKNVVSGCITCWYSFDKRLHNKLKVNIFYMKDFFKLIQYEATEKSYYGYMVKLGEEINEN